SMPPFASTRSEGISIKRNLNEVLPMLATRILFGVMGSARAGQSCRSHCSHRSKAPTRTSGLLRGSVRRLAAEEFSQPVQVVVRTRDHVDGDDFADGGRCGCAGFDGGLHRGDITFHKD